MDLDKELAKETEEEMRQLVRLTVAGYKMHLRFFPLAKGYLDEGNNIRITIDKGGYRAEKGNREEDGQVL